MSRNARAVVTISAGAIAITLLAVFWTLAQAYTPFAYGYPDHGQEAVSPVTTTAAAVKHVTIRLSIQQTVDRGPHGDWLGYQLQPPASLQPNPNMTSSELEKYKYGANIYTIPAHSVVTVIIDNYDSQTPLRNPYFSQVTGTVGGVAYCDANGQKGVSPPCGLNSLQPFMVVNPNITSHTFTIPDLGVSVPLVGIPGSNGFMTMKFTFLAPAKGTFRWQCIVPCGGGTYGFGGPMSEFGYMNGLFHFV
jgi:hypothetical protein